MPAVTKMYLIVKFLVMPIPFRCLEGIELAVKAECSIQVIII